MNKPELSNIPQAVQEKARARCRKKEQSIFIPGNVPSSKNGKRWVTFNTKPGSKAKRKGMLINSALVMRYIENTALYYYKHAGEFRYMVADLEPPYTVYFYFIRDSRRIFDYNNSSHVVTDLMRKNKWIDDDNMNWLIPDFSKRYEVNKAKAGVIITVEGGG